MKNTILNRLFYTISTCMEPVIPILMAGGVLKLFLILIDYIGLFSVYPDTKVLLTFISDSAFYFLPLFVAYSSACHFQTNPLFAMVVAASLLLPEFISFLEKREAVSFLFIPVYKTSYAYSVLPVILLIYIMSKIIKFFEKISASVFQTFFMPVIVITLTSLIGILFVGPLGSITGSGISSIIFSLQDISPLLAWAVFAGLTPLLLVTGTHWIFIAFVLESLGTTGIDVGYLVSFFICNMSIAATCFSTYLCEKNSPNRTSILSSGLVVLLSGVSEPSLFGVCVPKKYPLIAAVFGAFAGGLYQGVFTPYCMVYSFPAVLTILMFYQGDNPSNLFHSLAAASVGALCSFCFTFLFYYLFHVRKRASKGMSKTCRKIYKQT